MAVVMVAISLAFGALWGAFWAHVRDQGRIPGLPNSSKGKETGVALFGLPMAALALGFGWIEAALIWVGMAGGWSLGHMGGLGLRFYESRKGLSVPMAYLAMAGTGALVTLAPAGVLAWHGAWVAAAAVLLAGAAKVVTYEVGFLIRGLRPDPPHATYIGAIGHGAIAYSVTAAALVLS